MSRSDKNFDLLVRLVSEAVQRTLKSNDTKDLSPDDSERLALQLKDDVTEEIERGNAEKIQEKLEAAAEEIDIESDNPEIRKAASLGLYRRILSDPELLERLLSQSSKLVDSATEATQKLIGTLINKMILLCVIVAILSILSFILVKYYVPEIYQAIVDILKSLVPAKT